MPEFKDLYVEMANAIFPFDPTSLVFLANDMTGIEHGSTSLAPDELLKKLPFINERLKEHPGRFGGLRRRRFLGAVSRGHFLLGGAALGTSNGTRGGSGRTPARAAHEAGHDADFRASCRAGF